MEIVLIVVIGIFGISLVVAIHELGHLVAAKACGITVESFSIGWGPKLLAFTKNGTEYRISILPLGGYVRMKGEEDMKTALAENKPMVDHSPGSFFGAAPWKRIIVAGAGPLMNLLSAIIVLGFLLMPSTTQENFQPKIIVLSEVPDLAAAYPQTKIELTSKSSPAAKAGLRSGDIIQTINDQPVQTFSEIAGVFAKAPSLGQKRLKLSILRNNKTITSVVEPLLDTNTGIGQIGIRPWEEPIIASVVGEAAQAGLQSGDKIVGIDGMPIRNGLEAEIAVAKGRGTVRIDIIRNNQPKQIIAYPSFDKNGIGRLHIGYRRITTTTKGLSFPQAMGKGATEAIQTLGLIAGSFRLFGQGLDVTQAISGPIRTTVSIGQYTMAAFSAGLGEALGLFLRLLAIISIALFFGNLLPIPVLDGGQIVLYTIELCRRRPVSLSTIRRYNTVGFVLVALLLGLALVGDFRFIPQAFQ